jgi:vitamin B12/bleomycin/antimicrobial peptide transport system ATP-binding/permease protein
MTEPIEAGMRGLIHQFREFLVALRLSPGRRSLVLLAAATVFAVGATAAAQVSLNAWNGPFYEAVAQRNFSAFLYELLVFAAIGSGLLVLNVAQAWLREMIKVNSREWLTRDLLNEWLKPGRYARLAGAGEIGVNSDQRIHEDARRLTELSADLGIGLFQALVLLLCFLGVLWTVAGELHISIFGVSLPIPGYMVWCALLYAASGSWLTWRVGRPLVGLNSQRCQREAEFRFALVRANQQAETAARFRDAEGSKRRLGLTLGKVRGTARRIVYANAKLTWITAGYGWISIVAPIVIASPAYFSGRCSFGGLMVVVGAFYQVNQSLRWFVDNFALLAEWRAALSRVIRFREVLLTSESGRERTDIPVAMQATYGIGAEVESNFAQRETGLYRNGLRLADGRFVSLQDLQPGVGAYIPTLLKREGAKRVRAAESVDGGALSAFSDPEHAERLRTPAGDDGANVRQLAFRRCPPRA